LYLILAHLFLAAAGEDIPPSSNPCSNPITMDTREHHAATEGLPLTEFELLYHSGQQGESAHNPIAGFDSFTSEFSSLFDSQNFLGLSLDNTNWNGTDFFGPPFNFNPDPLSQSAQELHLDVSNSDPKQTENPILFTTCSGLNQTTHEGIASNSISNSRAEFPLEKNSTPSLEFTALESAYISNHVSQTPERMLKEPGPSMNVAIENALSSGKKTRVSKAAKDLLNNIFSSTAYPSKEQVAVLALQSGLTEKQIKTWFTNKRSRSSSRCEF
jgi:hypothetical protein